MATTTMMMIVILVTLKMTIIRIIRFVPIILLWVPSSIQMMDNTITRETRETPRHLHTMATVDFRQDNFQECCSRIQRKIVHCERECNACNDCNNDQYASPHC
jgi:hypothetical protein